MGDRPRIELAGALQSLYQFRDYSDLTICTRDGIRHPVHKVIVCPRSKLLTELVKAGRWRDNIVGDLALHDDDPGIVRLLIEYLYLLDYEPLTGMSGNSSPTLNGDQSDTMSVRTDALHFGHVYGTSAVSAFGGPRDLPSPLTAGFGHGRERSNSSLTVHAMPHNDFGGFGTSSTLDRRRRPVNKGKTTSSAPDPSPLATQEPNLLLHANIYAAAGKFGVLGLKALALDKFKIQLTKHWNSMEFAEAIHVVYHSTPPADKGMRGAIADALGWHGRLLDKPEVEVAVMEINGLAYELLKRSRRAEPEYD